jgi:rod shape-determining protein MreC
MNLDNAPQKLRWGLIGVLLLMVLGFMVVDATGNAEVLFSFMRDPFNVALNWTSAQVVPAVNTIEGPADLDEARAIIANLEEQVNYLEQENEQLREAAGENQVYEALLNLAQQTPNYERLAVQVIAYNSSPYFQSVVINAGTNNGLLVGMPVESTRGLIGQIYRTSSNASQVLLVTDTNSHIPVRLGNSRATGILQGSGGAGDMIIDWIDLEETVEVGETVFTAGLGGRFPEDLVIGRVTDIDRRESELHQKASVRANTAFADLEIVTVITNFRPIDTSAFDTPPGGNN